MVPVVAPVVEPVVVPVVSPVVEPVVVVDLVESLPQATRPMVAAQTPAIRALRQDAVKIVRTADVLNCM